MKIVHTSVHGVGHAFVQAAFKAFDLHLPYAVEEQKDPDPEFPTVKYPNPEEGKGVLVQYALSIHCNVMPILCLGSSCNKSLFSQTLSFALAEKEGAAVVLANDPDADRLAIAEKQERCVCVTVLSSRL